MAYLLVMDKHPRRHPLGALRVLIGRGEEARDGGLFLSDMRVSKKHAVLLSCGDRWRARDLDSGNGVFLNGRRVTEETLEEGDVLLIGGIRIVFRDETAAHLGEQPWLIHLESNTRIPLRDDGPTVFGRNPTFYDYGGVRWSPAEVEALRRADYVALPADMSMSRTHGRIQCFAGDCPTVKYTDLQSTNTSRRNGVELPGAEGTVSLRAHGSTAGMPQTLLVQGDVLELGRSAFQFERFPREEDSLRAERGALLVCAGAAEAFCVTRRILVERGFADERITLLDVDAEGARAYERAKSILRERAVERGTSVLYYRARLREGKLAGNGVWLETPARLVRFLSSVPGTKVVLLHTDVDPVEFREAVAAAGHMDTLFASCMGEDPAAEYPAEESLGPARRCPGTTFSIAPQDDLDDLLAAILKADDDYLRLDFLAKYDGRGRLVIVTGVRERSEEEYEYCLNSLVIGAGTSRRYRIGGDRRDS